MTSSRGLAAKVLRRIEQQGAFANLVLGPELARSGLDERDRRFVTDLVYGTTRMRRACDALVDRFLHTEPEADVRTLLRLGAYQLHYAGVAAHAAVGETVNLAPARARGFVNAVLRKVASTPMQWPSKAVELSYPDWMVHRLVGELGEAEAFAMLAAMNEAPTVTERDDGYTQDLGSQWVAAAVPARAGEVVLDVCAAPGGKATAMAATGATVVAADLQEHRVQLIGQNLQRLGATGVTALVADGIAPPFANASFHHVLIDAPCSGLGTLRRRADARWRVQPSDVEALASVQRALLVSSAPLVKVGGTLTYSVCTVLADESVHHPAPPGFEPISDRPDGEWRPFGAGWRVLPHHADTDGMVLLRYRRHS